MILLIIEEIKDCNDLHKYLKEPDWTEKIQDVKNYIIT